MKKSISSSLLVTLPVLVMAVGVTQVSAMQNNSETRVSVGTGVVRDEIGAHMNKIDDGRGMIEAKQRRVNKPEVREIVQKKRQFRKKAQVQLQKKLRNKKQVREFAVGQNKARLRDGANFSFDEETGLVTVVTPSGNEHTLNNLPDMAIEKMTEAGVIDPESSATADVVVDVADDRVVYRKNDTMKKKFLGVFPRSVKTEIVMDDSTGEVNEVPVTSSTFFGRLLDRLSF